MDKIERLKKKFAGMKLDSPPQLSDEDSARPINLTPLATPVPEAPPEGALSEEQMRAIIEKMVAAFDGRHKKGQ